MRMRPTCSCFFGRDGASPCGYRLQSVKKRDANRRKRLKTNEELQKVPHPFMSAKLRVSRVITKRLKVFSALSVSNFACWPLMPIFALEKCRPRSSVE